MPNMQNDSKVIAAVDAHMRRAFSAVNITVLGMKAARRADGCIEFCYSMPLGSDISNIAPGAEVTTVGSVQEMRFAVAVSRENRC